MIYNNLGASDIQVSRICLGTMTWGEQNTQEEAFAQMDYALEQGVNFWDTAELYAIPPKAATYGKTEIMIGNWFAKTHKRSQIILASKMAGPGPGFVDHIRGGHSQFNAQQIPLAIDASLKRLQTDYIDLYQLHWPERPTNYFGQLGFHAPQKPAEFTPFEETLLALSEQVKAGKIRMIGLSNETAWGVMKFLETAQRLGLEKIITIQNPYSLLNRSFEVNLAEVSHHEKVGLLAYSPLGFGVLSGKYLNGQKPKGARLSLFNNYTRYSSPNAQKATELYAALAKGNGLTPTQLALAFVNSRPFVSANIIGATTMEQLKENIASIEIQLSDEVLAQIERIHSQYTYPSP
ncbi:NADP(H)-dependent aldo-keto reductase [Thiosulfativibrio zosterae]|uniref:Protein tas n=1 Tax=Thiosulfativibrio zosterae TaxID=2675053 RepID=A0A6F8PN72_9GAMM|nr:NADP(H)-dependent aldo-keto reductase [Thiosulfativibrio zosterae]BBP43440.1 oxidoreductase [Thiosulfativibrio zosterae]